MPAAVSVYWDAKRVAAKTNLAVSTSTCPNLINHLTGCTSNETPTTKRSNLHSWTKSNYVSHRKLHRYLWKVIYFVAIKAYKISHFVEDNDWMAKKSPTRSYMYARSKPVHLLIRHSRRFNSTTWSRQLLTRLLSLSAATCTRVQTVRFLTSVFVLNSVLRVVMCNFHSIYTSVQNGHKYHFSAVVSFRVQVWCLGHHQINNK